MSSSDIDVTCMTLQLLKTITDDFSEEKKVGSGGYGEVYKAVLDGDEVAVKMLYPMYGLDDDSFLNEFRNLMKVKHKNIIRLIGYCYEIAHRYTSQNGEFVFAKVIDRALCFEYIQGGSLANHISDEPCIHDWHTTYNIIKGICAGLLYLHKGRGEKNRIYHLDLKPDNILLDKDMVPKIGDFGLSRLFVESKTYQTSTTKGTRGLMAPEYLENQTVSEKNDVFSLGVIIFHMMAGKMGYLNYFESRSYGEELIETLQENWKKKMQEYWNKRTLATAGYTLDELQLLEVSKCIKIAMRCVETDRKKRPPTKKIIDDLIGQSLDVVIVHAFDCSTRTLDWDKVGDQVFWMVQEKLTGFVDSYLGYTYVMSTPNTYTSHMKLVVSTEKKANGYTESVAWRRTTCAKNMASGLPEAHKLISDHGHLNGIILLFSDGLINKGDFFDGAENFISEVPVHTFTLGGDAYNYGLRAIAENSRGGTFHDVPVPEKPCLSVPFSRLLGSILSGAMRGDEKHPSPGSDGWPLDVVIVYAFDSTDWTPAWYKVDDVFWLVQQKLTATSFVGSALGYTYVMSTPNTCISDMKLAPRHLDKKATGGYTVSSASSDTACTKNMAYGLSEAHKLMSYREHLNGIILLFSDGLINKGDFFDGAENYKSKMPVHTFTLGGDVANGDVLKAIAKNSPGGKFHEAPVPDKPILSEHFSDLLDSLLVPNLKQEIHWCGND